MSEQSIAPAASAIEDIDSAPNPFMAVITGTAAMLIGAAVWAAISYFTNYQIGWLSIGIGFLIGVAIQKFGHGNSVLYGILGGVLALIAVVLGNLLFYSLLIAEQESASVVEVLFFLLLSPVDTMGLFGAAFEVIDLLFYALAMYAGFRYSFKQS